MTFSGMLRNVVLVRTDVSEERVSSIFRVERISELGKTLIVSATETHYEETGVFQLLVNANIFLISLILSAVKTEAIRSSETLVVIRPTTPHIPEDGILHSHRRENRKSYIALTD
jgi:hypothetical protein